ncbi:hypothetical protein FJZ48_01500 [Candidatus Uhrbacteria bacterium]|nr:hypothetical protein [Candidatus Uhrbacteria bacterium]
MPQKSSRLEWVSLLYLVFFVFAVLSPSFITREHFGLSQTWLEEITIFFFGMAGLVTFTIYERVMERRAKESEKIQDAYQRAKTELIDSYAYIGAINRKIELLKKLANDTSRATVDARLSKDLFSALAANACAAVGARAALIRCVELSKLRTDREFIHHTSGQMVFRVHNRDLKMLHEQKVGYDFVKAEDGQKILVIPSDGKRDHKAYLLLAFSGDVQDVDTSLLKVFINQAEMLYHQLTGLPSVSTPVLAEAPKSV